MLSNQGWVGVCAATQLLLAMAGQVPLGGAFADAHWVRGSRCCLCKTHSEHGLKVVFAYSMIALPGSRHGSYARQYHQRFWRHVTPCVALLLFPPAGQHNPKLEGTADCDEPLKDQQCLA